MNVGRVIDPGDPAITYAAVLDALPIIAYMARPDGSISYVSSSWEQITGIHARELIERGYETVIHPDDRKRAAAKWQAALEANESYSDDLRLRFSDGSFRWMTSHADPLREHGRIIGWFGTVTDIDARRKAEAALSRSESLYRAFSAAIPGVTWAASPAGELTFVGERWTSLHGKPREGALGESWLESVFPADRQRVLSVWAASLESGEPYDIQFRVRVADGSYRWFLVRALPVLDDAGEVVQWVGVNVDIEHQRRADESREQFVRLVENSIDFIGIMDESGNATYVNEAGRRLLELGTINEVRGRNILEFLMPEEHELVSETVRSAVANGGNWIGELRFKNNRTGEPLPVSSNVFSLHDDAGNVSGFATVSRDVRSRYRVEAGLRVLADTGAVMFRSLDFAQTLRNVADAVTREFATYLIVDIVGRDGRLQPIVTAHENPNLGDALQRAVAARHMTADHHVSRACRDGVSTVISELENDWVDSMNSATDDVRSLAARSMMCVPLRSSATGQIIGALTFVVDDRDLRGGYTPDDLHFAEEVGLRAGIAFEHARAYERERRIAVTLQEASLPSSLPEPEGIRLSADYRPGNSEATIGGDWYDAFTLEDGRLVITIGDVMGNGLAAAVTMGKLRQVMQSVALVLADPQLMLAAADRTVRSISSETYATALAAIYDPAAREFRMATAGHPMPVMRNGKGAIVEFSASGSLLGLWSREPYEEIIVPVMPASSLVFFTDGLIEATRDTDEGYRRLRAALAGLAGDRRGVTAGDVVEHALRGEKATDDIAVLVVTIA